MEREKETQHAAQPLLHYDDNFMTAHEDVEDKLQEGLVLFLRTKIVTLALRNI